MNALTEVFLEEGYTSAEDLFRGWALLTAMSKVDHYSAECERFEVKYGEELQAFEAGLHREKGREDVEKEADLEDWMFATEAVKWWRSKVEELQGAARP